jgi:hypothetical protein
MLDKIKSFFLVKIKKSVMYKFSKLCNDHVLKLFFFSDDPFFVDTASALTVRESRRWGVNLSDSAKHRQLNIDKGND